jgi:S-adenosylmethionine synthetase
MVIQPLQTKSLQDSSRRMKGSTSRANNGTAAAVLSLRKYVASSLSPSLKFLPSANGWRTLLNLIIRQLDSLPPGAQPVEVVERKGIGHPDTICDGIAEHICVKLCRYYLDRFGLILHHNVDKILLCGGSARASFGGGEVLQPIEIYIAGRATREYHGEGIPVHELAAEACQEWLQIHLPALDVRHHVQVFPRIRPGSSDLVELFESNTSTAVSNDTSCCAGFAPLTDLEKVVLEVEQTLNSGQTKQIHPAIGSDIKIMGVRQDDHIDLTIGCAFLSSKVPDINEYVRKKREARALALQAASRVTRLSVETTINAADNLDSGSVFLTVTGTSAEAGDDGEVGRGNRTGGLITPYRVMTLEAAAGKNPISHVGKLYSVLASRIAKRLVNEFPSITDAQCVLVSQIGRPVIDPRIVDIRLTDGTGSMQVLHKQVDEIVRRELGELDQLRNELLGERVSLY